jgi:rhodanese-related sulfurtransferase
MNNREIFPDKDSLSTFSIKESISEDSKKKYGITYDEIKKIKATVYYIDGREREEFEKAHAVGAVNIRVPDIRSFDSIKNVLGLSESKIDSSFFVIYCHDGTRSVEAVSRIQRDNVKFLIDGRENFYREDFESEGDISVPPFPDYIQNKNFTVNVADGVQLVKDGAFVIDGRLYSSDYLFPIAYEFRIGQLSTSDYEDKIKTIKDQKDKQIIFIGNVYPDLFYAKLFIYRLERDHNFDFKNFKVIFGQDKIFYEALKKEGLI